MNPPALLLTACGIGGILSRFNADSVIGSEHQKFSFRGFSAKRLAYLLIGVQLWLFCLVDREAYYDATGGIAALSLSVMLVNLLLGLLCPSRDKSRFLPFAFAFFILVMTMLFIPL